MPTRRRTRGAARLVPAIESGPSRKSAKPTLLCGVRYYAGVEHEAWTGFGSRGHPRRRTGGRPVGARKERSGGDGIRIVGGCVDRARVRACLGTGCARLGARRPRRAGRLHRTDRDREVGDPDGARRARRGIRRRRPHRSLQRRGARLRLRTPSFSSSSSGSRISIPSASMRCSPAAPPSRRRC